MYFHLLQQKFVVTNNRKTISKIFSSLLSTLLSPYLSSSVSSLSSSLIIIVLIVSQCPMHETVITNFNVHELTHDSPSNIKITEANTYSLHYRDSFQMSLRPMKSNRTLRLFLSKPYRLRELEFETMHLSGEVTHLVDVQESDPPRIEIAQLMPEHIGNYSLYRFEYDSFDGSLMYKMRDDFQLNINDLIEESGSCRHNSQCKSNLCIFRRCFCTEQYPIFNGSECHSGKNLNESCRTNKECQVMAGKNAECFEMWQRCRCNQNTVPIKIHNNIRRCVTPEQLNDTCVYSKQCSLLGPNRFCGPDYRCECLPGYQLKAGRSCINPSSSSVSVFCSNNMLLQFTMLLTIVAKIKLNQQLIDNRLVF